MRRTPLRAAICVPSVLVCLHAWASRELSLADGWMISKPIRRPSPTWVRYHQSTTPLFAQPTIEDEPTQQKNNNNGKYESAPQEVFDEDYGLEIPSRQELESMTVSQLKQQLRLRGEKVSGKKSELIDRLDMSLRGISSAKSSLGRQEDEIIAKAKANGGEPIDVSEYVEVDDSDSEYISSRPDLEASTKEEDDDDDESTTSSNGPETWGEEAKIVEDYEGRSVVVDGLSRTEIEFIGSNRTKISAYVTASRQALKPFLAGGNRGQNVTADTPEERVKKIQLAREAESKAAADDFRDVEAPNTGDEAGYYKNVVERDYGDWGSYTPTGVGISAGEIQGVLLLADVYGAFSDDMQALADKIAFECQPVVVMSPDLFRRHPWKEDPSRPGFNHDGETYEEWRLHHPDQRVNVDIRAAAAVLRDQYSVSSIAVWGICYGGGRALEVAGTWFPGNNPADVDGRDGPPPVDPAACIAWYPTRYNATAIFGPGKQFTPTVENQTSKHSSVAVMAIFAAEDSLLGARPEDAAELKSLLNNDDRIKDAMIKIFPDQDHGFAHRGIGAVSEDPSDTDKNSDRFLENEFGGPIGGRRDGGDPEVAALLSTAWMETYTRVFLPTIGASVMDEENSSWNTELEAPNFSKMPKRDIRKEVEDAIANQKDLEIDLSKMQPYQYTSEIDDLETMEELPKANGTKMDDELLKILRDLNEDFAKTGISDDDDFETSFKKFNDAYKKGDMKKWEELQGKMDRGEMETFPGIGEPPMDNTENAYW